MSAVLECGVLWLVIHTDTLQRRPTEHRIMSLCALQSDPPLVCVVLIAEPAECVATHIQIPHSPTSSQSELWFQTENLLPLRFSLRYRREKKHSFWRNRHQRLRVFEQNSKREARVAAEAEWHSSIFQIPLAQSVFLWYFRPERPGEHLAVWFVSPTAPNISAANWSRPPLQLFSILQISNRNLIIATKTCFTVHWTHQFATLQMLFMFFYD